MSYEQFEGKVCLVCVQQPAYTIDRGGRRRIVGTQLLAHVVSFTKHLMLFRDQNRHVISLPTQYINRVAIVNEQTQQSFVKDWDKNEKSS